MVVCHWPLPVADPGFLGVVNYWEECATLLPSAMKLGQGNVFTSVCDSVHSGGCTWQTTPPGTRYTPPGPDQVPPRPGTPPPGTRYPPYASYWNAFLLLSKILLKTTGERFLIDLGPHCTGPSVPRASGLRHPQPPPSYWHLVLNTGNLFKLVHLRTPPPIREQDPGVATEARMLSLADPMQFSAKNLQKWHQLGNWRPTSGQSWIRHWVCRRRYWNAFLHYCRGFQLRLS